MKLHTDKTLTPIVQAERRILYVLRQKVQNEIEFLEENGITENINNEKWLDPLVTVPKTNDNNKIRLCLDVQNVNAAV